MTETYTVILREVIEHPNAVFGGHVGFYVPGEKEMTCIYMRSSLKGAKPGDTMEITMDSEIGVRKANIVKRRRLAWFLTLLTLILASLACSVQVPNALPTATRAALGTHTPTPNALVNTPEPKPAIVKAAAINVRQSPDGDVIAVLSAGNRVTLLDKCLNNWCKVQTVIGSETVTGFIFKGCLKLKSGLGCTAK